MEVGLARGVVVRCIRAAVALACLSCLANAATYKTPNFLVEAPSPDAARKVGDEAELRRKTLAMAWLGHELPNWGTRCSIHVKLTAGEAGGLTDFDFDRGRVIYQAIEVEGRLDRILASSLPHEVTHTIFAAYFGGPMPRWADEGTSLLSEDLRELQRHDRIVADLLSRRGDYALASLFMIEEYPADLMGFYGQGYSVSRFLVETGGRPKFLKFVKDGSRSGWDAAARLHYGISDCRELDRAWRSWHRVVASRPADVPSRAIVLRGQSPGVIGR